MTKSIPVSVKESIVVNATPTDVWDYTQDWRNRREWDSSVEEVVKIEEAPSKRIVARFKGGIEFSIQYKLNERPKRTSLAMTNSSSKWIIGGGGSWHYNPSGQSTEWIQHNSIVFRDHFLIRILKPILNLALKNSTRTSMRAAKKIIEQRNRHSNPAVSPGSI